MVACVQSFFEGSGLSPALAFTFSDEVNLIFLEAPFAGRVEKIDSLIAAYLSAALSLSLGRLVSMDCRTIPLCRSEIGKYLAERQDEAWRNHVFSYGFYQLIEQGSSPSEAMQRLRGLAESDIHELVFSRGINLAKTPAWERRGTMVYRQEELVAADWHIPLFSSEEGKDLLKSILERDGSRD
jgi:tRNA(His) 5'-end guanylyltransferase